MSLTRVVQQARVVVHTSARAYRGRMTKNEHSEETIDEPVMDGATDHEDTDADPRKGMSDPALIRDVESGKKTTNPYG